MSGALVEHCFDGDLPRVYPASDLFGYAPFARRLAASITNVRSPGGVVLAVTGEWGAGKSTLLNFVKNELSNAQVAPYPVIIDFNPWWFSSRDDLAPQMIRALRDRIAGDQFTYGDISSALTKYAEGIGSTAETFAGSVGKIVSQIVMAVLRKRDQSFSSLKHSIAKELAGCGQKYVFFVDDIDRLAPSEIVELLKAVKAIGDFPNVIYVLAFDRKVVTSAVRTAISTDGDAYLEKIVQAVFPVPAIDRLTLRKWLFEQLDAVIAANPGIDFDSTYWSEMFFDGLDILFSKPRDVVRFVNTISITYPAVAGDVNPMDFIALESLRLFFPQAHEVIRENPDRFAGHPREREEGVADREFHAQWLLGLGDSKRSKGVAEILSRVFPRFGSARSEYHYSSGPKNWRRSMRVCDPAVFPIYFQFAVPGSVAGRTLLSELQAAANGSADAVRLVLQSSLARRDAAGVPQSRDLIERLADDEEEVSPIGVPNLLSGLMMAGDEIASADEQGHSGFFGVPINFRLVRVIARLAAEIPEVDRLAELTRSFSTGSSVSLMTWVVGSVDRVLRKAEAGSKELEAYEGFEQADLFALRDIVAEKFRALGSDRLLDLPALNIVVTQLLEWGERNAVRTRLLPLILNSDLLPYTLERLASYSRIQSSSDPVVRKKPRLDPRIFDRFVDGAWFDFVVEECARREGLTPVQREVVRSYQRARETLASGGSLDSFWDPDD